MTISARNFLLSTSMAVATLAATAPTKASAFEPELYGQVHKSFMVFDDGRLSRANVVDNNVSSTRFGLRAEKDINYGLTASFLMEVQANDNSSASLTQANSGTDVAADTLSARHMRVGLGGNWGALFAGRTATASDGITEIDLGSVGDALTSSSGRLAGSLSFRQEDGTLSAIQLNEVADGFDGIAFGGGSASDDTDRFGSGFGDRINNVRYVSPKFKNTQLSVSYVQGDDMDLALRYNRRWEELGLDMAMGVATVRYDTPAVAAGQNKVDAQYSGSFSARHDSGYALTLAGGFRDYEQRAAGIEEPWLLYAKASKQFGNWGVAVDYAHNNNIDTTFAGDSVVDVWGAGVQHDLGHGLSAAIYGRIHDLERDGVATEALQVYGFNLRAKF